MGMKPVTSVAFLSEFLGAFAQTLITPLMGGGSSVWEQGSCLDQKRMTVSCHIFFPVDGRVGLMIGELVGGGRR